MKVLIGIPCLLLGGTEMQTLSLVRALVKGGHEVKVLCYFEHNHDVVYAYKQGGSEVMLLRYSRSVRKSRFILGLAEVMRVIKPDVVHVQYMAPGALPVIAARLAGISKVVATVHQPWTPAHGEVARLLLRSAALLCRHFIAVSPAAERSWFGSSYIYSADAAGRAPRHFTLYNCIETERIGLLEYEGECAGIREAMGFGSDFVFGYMGRLRYEKGADLLCEAFAIVSESFSGVRLLIVGDGPDREMLENRFGHEPWWKKVHLVGELSWDDAMRHIAAIDAVVVPSRFEGFGLSAAEAMAASKPVIASRCGGLEDVVKHEISGMLCEPGNVKELSVMMLQLMKDSQSYDRLQKGALQRAKEFDVTLYQQIIIHLYKQLAV